MERWAVSQPGLRGKEKVGAGVNARTMRSELSPSRRTAASRTVTHRGRGKQGANHTVSRQDNHLRHQGLALLYGDKSNEIVVC